MLFSSFLKFIHVSSPERVQFDGLRKQAGFLLKTKHYSQAIEYAKRAMALQPDNPWPYIQIALALAHMKNPEGTEWAQKAISVAPDNGWCWAALADTMTLRGKWAQGLEPLMKAVSKDPENPRFLSFLGYSLIRVKRHSEAVPYLRKALELNPEDAETHYRLYVALLRTRDKKGSHYHLRKALELRPDSSEVQSSLGWRLLGKGMQDEADQTFREALRLDPQNPAAKVGLGAPAGRKKGMMDRLLRYSVSVYSLPQRGVLAGIQSLMVFGLYGAAAMYPALWELKVVFAIFLIWYIYFLLSWPIVKAIGRRRGVAFF